MYWARCFNELESRKPYDSLRESCHIGILAFTLFPEEAEFYSEYRIQNWRTQRQYTDKFCIRILDLTKTEMADENTQKDILQWARMIKAGSREEMDAIAEERQMFGEVAELVKVLNNDKKIREQCEARFFYECDMASMRAEGRAEGRAEVQTEIIGQLYHNGFSAERIAEITGKQTEEVYVIIRRYDGAVV